MAPPTEAVETNQHRSMRQEEETEVIPQDPGVSYTQPTQNEVEEQQAVALEEPTKVVDGEKESSLVLPLSGPAADAIQCSISASKTGEVEWKPPLARTGVESETSAIGVSNARQEITPAEAKSLTSENLQPHKTSRSDGTVLPAPTEVPATAAKPLKMTRKQVTFAKEAITIDEDPGEDVDRIEEAVPSRQSPPTVLGRVEVKMNVQPASSKSSAALKVKDGRITKNEKEIRLANDALMEHEIGTLQKVGTEGHPGSKIQRLFHVELPRPPSNKRETVTTAVREPPVGNRTPQFEIKKGPQEKKPLDTSSLPKPLQGPIFVDKKELLQMEARTHISCLSLKNEQNLPGNAFKKVTDSKTFEAACLLAAKDHRGCAKSLVKQARGNLEAMVEFATLLISAPVGRIGSRRNMRAAAVILLDRVLSINSNHTIAMCVKGEMLLPRPFFGTGPSDTPYPVIEEAFSYFCKADMLGSREGRFLRGRWLVTLSSIHKSRRRTREGMQYVKEAADGGHARAYVFLAQVHEFPGKYGWNDGNPTKANKKQIVQWYLKAAELGNPEALNDVGSCYATGFGGLPYSFDEAIRYYVHAVKAGALMAFENLGTHYETGMSGMAEERIDYQKAMFYYRQGARVRCSKCAYNIAVAYDEGLGDEVERDTRKVESYLRYSLIIAEDDNDEFMKKKSMKDLVTMYLCRIKTSEHDADTVKETMTKLSSLLNKRMLHGTLDELNKCLAAAVRNNDDVNCITLLGETSGRLVFKAAKQLVAELQSHDDEVDEGIESKLSHMFGSYAKQIKRDFFARPQTKRRRVIVDISEMNES